ncbi:hypothetical protein Q7P37_008652 [Cladosporium fusiforme]
MHQQSEAAEAIAWMQIPRQLLLAMPLANVRKTPPRQDGIFDASGMCQMLEKEAEEAGAACIQRRMGVVLDPSQPEPTSWIERLQENVQRLELEATEAQQESVSPHDVATGSSDRISENQNGTQNEAPPQGANLETTMHVMDYLPLSAMAEQRDRQHFSLQQYSFETFLGAAASVSGSDPKRSHVSNRAIVESMEAFYQEISPSGFRLSRKVADLPVQRYLSTCDVMCPFLERKDFLAKYTLVMNDLEKEQSGEVASRAPHDMILVCLAVATGIHLSPNYGYKESLAVNLAQSALRLMSLLLSGSDNASIIRSLIALVIFSTYSILGGSTWHLIGLALARAMSSGMHTFGISDLYSSDLEKRENGRLFWSLYVLDATISHALERPFCVQDRDITTPMPLSTSRSAPDDSVNFLVNAVQYAHLLREIRRTASMGTVFHLANYKHWKYNCIERTTLATEPDLRQLMMDAISSISCKIVLQIWRVASNKQGGGISHLQTTADVELAELVRILQRRAEAQDGVLTALDGYDLTSIGIYFADRHMEGVNSDQMESEKLLRDCLDLLSDISQRFSGMKDLRDMLRSKTQHCEGCTDITHHRGNLT